MGQNQQFLTSNHLEDKEKNRYRNKHKEIMSTNPLPIDHRKEPSKLQWYEKRNKNTKLQVLMQDFEIAY